MHVIENLLLVNWSGVGRNQQASSFRELSPNEPVIRHTTSYNVRVDGIVRRRHADQLRRRYLDSQPEEITEFPVDDLTNRPQQPPIFPEIGCEPEHPAASSIEGKPLTIPATDVVQNELPAADGTVTEKSAVPPVSVVAHDLHRSQRGLVPVKPRLYQYYADNSNMK